MDKDEIKGAEEEIKRVGSLSDLNNLRAKYLGKSGILTGLLHGLRELSPEERPGAGAVINKRREILEELFFRRERFIKDAEVAAKVREEKIDVTLNKPRSAGAKHPLTLVKDEIIDIFAGLGFTVSEGPETETDYYCFQALNIPKDHPARDMQDTFYISDNIVLRTHTSPNQIRYLEKVKPPVKMLSPGAVYRNDDDATHSPMFNQIEGLVVDRNVTLCDLMGTLELFAKALFGTKTNIRFRPSYFPFTEPSVEVDVTCAACGGKGCRMCKGTGWLEVLGAGLVHPEVLKYAGVDAAKYSGFAFGLGIDRIALLKYKIPDIRLLYENDIRFLEQFI